jgi:phenylpyruvate tautomerase PptA (4-oxalocrotonate tautomerase family)
MPVVTIKVLEGELTWGQTADMVADVTEAAVPFVGEAVRFNVQVLVEKANRKVRAMNPWRKEQRNGG